jgi:diguanylate cyclase (GGDEF)-like protein/PAS domain S-box-containing protein
MLHAQKRIRMQQQSMPSSDIPPVHGRWNAWILVAFNIALLMWLALRPGEPAVFRGVAAIACVLAALIGCYWCVPWGIGRLRGRSDLLRQCRRSIMAGVCLSLGTLSLAFGQVAWYFYEHILHIETPFPSWADLGYLSTYPCLICGILLLPGRRRPGTILVRVLLDSLMIVAAAATFSWHFLIAPALETSEAGLLLTTLALAYPIADLVVLFCLLLTLTHIEDKRLKPVVLPLALGVMALVISDSLFCYRVLAGTYVTGTVLDIGWAVSPMLIGLGTGRIARSPWVDTTADDLDPHGVSAWRALLPYGLLPPIVLLLIHSHGESHTGLASNGTYVLALSVVVFVFIRQLVAIGERSELFARLRETYVRLDESHRALESAHKDMQRSEERFRIAAECAGDLIYELDPSTGALQWFGDMDGALGYAKGTLGQDMQTWEKAVHPEDLPRLHQSLYAHLDEHVPFVVEYRMIAADGSIRYFAERGRAVRDSAGRPIRMIGAMTDITPRRLAEDRLRHESLHDALTGLPNRAMFTDRLQRAVTAARTAGSHYAVLFLDLDHFKVINDSLGHAAGDRLLITIANRLQQCLASRACQVTVARLGGDEFTVLLERADAPPLDVEAAERIQVAVRVPLDFEGHDISTTVSIGVVQGASRYYTAKDVLRDADVAMYRAKALGRGRHVLFDETMHASAVKRLRLESDLRHAVERGELLLHYQPMVSLETRQIESFEALLRWQRDGQLVPPADFISVAEDSGLIVEIGRWVIEEACRQLTQWRAAGMPPVTVSVNLSRRQLADAQLVAFLRDVLERTRVEPACFKLEITESLIMEESQQAMHTLHCIKNLGIGLHMDDFGTGYSSLSCLHRFPVEMLKIDRSFIANLSERRDYSAVIHAILDLARNLSIRVVAEGVETIEQVSLLQALGCDLAQGYFFARPLPAADAALMLMNPPRLAMSA